MKPTTRTASIGPTYFWGLFMFAAFALLAVFYFRFGPKPESYDDKRAAIRSEKLQVLTKDDAEKLSAYKILDPAKGTAQIPIQRAMELVVADLQGKKPAASAVKVEVPYPVGLAQPAAAVAVPPGATSSPAPGQNTAPASLPAGAPQGGPTPAAVPSPAASPVATAVPKPPAPSPSPASLPATAPNNEAPLPMPVPSAAP